MEDDPMSEYSLYVDAYSAVFWDVEGFPLPDYITLDSFKRRIRHALRFEGYLGDLKARAYCKGNSYVAYQHYLSYGVVLVSQANEKPTRNMCMIHDMVEWATSRPHWWIKGEKNLLVISKGISQDSKFTRVVKALRERKYNVFVIVPDDCPRDGLPDATLVWRWSKLLNGRFPIDPCSDSVDNPLDEGYKSDYGEEDEVSSQGVKRERDDSDAADSDKKQQRV